MRAIVLVALLGALVAAASAMDLESQILEQLWAYEATQNGMNATAAANLFTETGVANAPLGANTVVGKDNVQKFFSGFFGSIKYLIEDVLGEWVILGNFASGSKLLQTAINPKCPVSVVVNQFFEFDNSTSPPLIAVFNVQWNVTKFMAQASCQGTYPLPEFHRKLLGMK